MYLRRVNLQILDIHQSRSLDSVFLLPFERRPSIVVDDVASIAPLMVHNQILILGYRQIIFRLSCVNAIERVSTVLTGFMH